MNGKVVFTEKSLDAKLAADAIGSVLSGRADMQWCRANNQLSARGVWNRETDVLIHKPVSLWKKMCSGYHPRAGRDYEFKPCGVVERPDVGYYGDDESAADDDAAADDVAADDAAADDAAADDESAADDAANLSVTIAGDTDTPSNTPSDNESWRADDDTAADDVDDETDWDYEVGNEPGDWDGDIYDSVTPPAAPDVTHSWRAEVVERAVSEDMALSRRRMDVSFRRFWASIHRRGAIRRGARPYEVGYALTSNIVVFDGEIYRVIDLTDDIPF